MGVQAPHEIVFRHLARYLGPHTARTALKTFSERSLQKPPELVTRLDAPKLLLALRPMLRTLIGADECEAVLQQVTRELSL
ncbi:MAG: hypothetical protein ACXVAN_19030 [Polyangia bacterium]